MMISECSHEAVLHVARNMRARDKEEIYGLRRRENPFDIVNDVMAQPLAWVAWLDGMPAAVFGGCEMRPGVWSMFAFATDEFPRLALPLTRFALKQVIPRLFRDLGAHRLQCESHEKHADAHRWLHHLGATRESVKVGFGKDGSNYFEFVIVKSKGTIDSQYPTK